MAKFWFELFLKYKRILRNPDRQFHMDQALTRVGEVETESLELFTHNETARHAAGHARKVSRLTADTHAAAAG